MKKAGYDLAPLIERIVFAPLRFICEIRPWRRAHALATYYFCCEKRGMEKGKMRLNLRCLSDIVTILLGDTFGCYPKIQVNYCTSCGLKSVTISDIPCNVRTRRCITAKVTQTVN